MFLGRSWIWLLLSVSACSTVDTVHTTAAKLGFSAVEVAGPSDAIRLAAFARGATGDTMNIYIEGDGAAWITPYHPPHDPTPAYPVALALAGADPLLKVAYLGRPCQYLNEEELKRCDLAYWTEKRFSPEVIAAYDTAVSRLMQQMGVRRIRLIGYSGGGVIATLLAGSRGDVDELITVASPLSVSAWVAWHNASPLTGSLDPADLTGRLPLSIHFVGRRDKVVAVSVVEAFVNRRGGFLKVVSDFDHECCWVRDWGKLLGRSSVLDHVK